MANRRPTSLSKRAYDLQTRVSAARIAAEARLHVGRTSGNWTADQERDVTAYRNSPEGRSLSALWELAGVVSQIASVVEATAGVYTEVTAEERAALAAPKATVKGPSDD